jgi:hypothetical protein
MQPLFSNARSKAAENHVKLSDTRRATLAWLALLIMRARHDLLVAARAEFRQFRDQVSRDRRPDARNRGEQIFLFAALPGRRTAHDEDRGRSKTGVSPLNLAVVRSSATAPKCRSSATAGRPPSIPHSEPQLAC